MEGGFGGFGGGGMVNDFFFVKTLGHPFNDHRNALRGQSQGGLGGGRVLVGWVFGG